MGQFSYLCKNCHKGIKEEEECLLFLLVDGKIVEEMTGKYTNYGTVYAEPGHTHRIHQRKYSEYIPDRDDAGEERYAVTWQYDTWGNIVDLEFKDQFTDMYGISHIKEITPNGFAAYHKKCYRGETPTLSSESDPNQGWGTSEEKYEYRLAHKLELYKTLLEHLIFNIKVLNDSEKFDYIPQLAYHYERQLEQLNDNRLFDESVLNWKERLEELKDEAMNKRNFHRVDYRSK